MLDKVPREVILKLLVEFLSPTEAFFLRFLCRAVSSLASAAFETQVRSMVQNLDISLRSTVQAIRKGGRSRVGFDGCLSDHYSLGRLFRSIGGTLRDSAIMAFIVKEFRDGLYQEDGTPTDHARLVCGLCGTPSSSDICFLMDLLNVVEDGLSVDFYLNPMIANGVAKETCVEAVLHNLQPSQVTLRIPAVARMEQWPRNQLSAAHILRLFNLLDKSSVNGARDFDYFANASEILRQILDTESLRLQAVLLNPEGWEMRGRLAVHFISRFRSWADDLTRSMESATEILTAALETSPDSLAQIPFCETPEERRSFLQGICSEAIERRGRLIGRAATDAFSIVLGVLLRRDHWPDERKVQAKDCITKETLSPLSLGAVLKLMEPDVERLAKLIEHVDVDPAELLSQALEEEGVIFAQSPRLIVYSLLSALGPFVTASVAYKWVALHPEISIIRDDLPRVSFTAEKCCQLLVLCFFQEKDAMSMKLERIGGIAEGWIKSIGASRFYNSDLASKFLQSLWDYTTTRTHPQNRFRTFGLVCGAPTSWGQIFSSARLAQILSANDEFLASCYFTSYETIGEFVTGHSLALGKFRDLTIEQGLERKWKFTAPGHLVGIRVEGMPDGRRRARMVRHAGSDLEQVQVKLL